eukprot:5847742-Amphidinium_carterae.2
MRVMTQFHYCPSLDELTSSMARMSATDGASLLHNTLRGLIGGMNVNHPDACFRRLVETTTMVKQVRLCTNMTELAMHVARISAATTNVGGDVTTCGDLPLGLLNESVRLLEERMTIVETSIATAKTDHQQLVERTVACEHSVAMLFNVMSQAELTRRTVQQVVTRFPPGHTLPIGLEQTFSQVIAAFPEEVGRNAASPEVGGVLLFAVESVL